MSDKVTFIRDCVIRKMPEPSAIEQVIVHAELLWKELTARGYGDKKSLPVTVKGDSAYQSLSEEQRVWFDWFWTAFNYKAGKEGAAKEWLRLGNLTGSQYESIIAAAKRAATIPLPQGMTRKMAQGWLSEKRYEDEHYATSSLSNRKPSAVEQVGAARTERKRSKLLS